MTEKEFTDIATELRELALRKGRDYPLDSDEADDIAQETMLKLWAIRGKVDDGQHARGLAMKIAVHLAIDKLRKRRSMPARANGKEQLAIADGTPDTDLEDKDNDEWLTRQLGKLPPMEYQVLHLRQAEQKSNAEIAAILGTTLQSVATLLSRARHRLMEQIRQKNRR